MSVAEEAGATLRPSSGRCAGCRSGSEGRHDVVGSQANVETVHTEAVARDADQERLVGSPGDERAVLNQPAEIAAVELASLAPLDRADEVDPLARDRTSTADEVDLHAAVTVPE